MPKDRRLNFLSSDRPRASPYACSSKDSNHDKLENSLPPFGDEKEWEEARCSICMEHPHNAVLLLCSSRDKGCRPYMCDTSHRHSNCLDQFCKSVTGASSLQEDVTVARMQYPRGRVEQTLFRPTRSTGGEVPELLCPLCRGQISGWVVIENARCCMNSKVRSCSLESCNFTGNYVELRKHARREHPTVKPSDVDPERQSEWVRLERERDLGDTLSAIQSQFGYDSYVGYGPGYSPGYSPSVMPFHWTSDGSISDETEDEWSEDGGMSVDLDVGVEFTFSFLNESSFGPSEGARNTSSARTRSVIARSMMTRSRANYRGGITSPGRNDTISGSEGARNIGGERTGGRSLNRRSIRSRSRSRSRPRPNRRVESIIPRRWGTTPSRLDLVSVRNTGNERAIGRSVGRISMRSRSRSRSNRLEIHSPGRQGTATPRSGSEWARNTGSARIGSRSLGRRLIPRRSSSLRGTTSPRRWSTSSSSSRDSWRYAE